MYNFVMLQPIDKSCRTKQFSNVFENSFIQNIDEQWYHDSCRCVIILVTLLENYCSLPFPINSGIVTKCMYQKKNIYTTIQLKTEYGNFSRIYDPIAESEQASVKIDWGVFRFHVPLRPQPGRDTVIWTILRRRLYRKETSLNCSFWVFQEWNIVFRTNPKKTLFRRGITTTEWSIAFAKTYVHKGKRPN